MANEDRNDHNSTTQQRRLAPMRSELSGSSQLSDTLLSKPKHTEAAPPAQPGQHTAIRAFQLDGSGVRRLLGSLEADLLEAVWRLTPGDASSEEGWITIAAVCASLIPTFHYKTSQTVMNRLVEKQLLVRRERQRAYEYRAALSREELITQVTRSVVGGLIHDFGDVAVAQLTQTLYETRPELLSQLERLAGTTQAPDPEHADRGEPPQTGAGHDAPPTTASLPEAAGKRSIRKRKE